MIDRFIVLNPTRQDNILALACKADGGDDYKAWAATKLGFTEDMVIGFLCGWMMDDGCLPPSNAREFTEGWYKARRLAKDLNATPKVAG